MGVLSRLVSICDLPGSKSLQKANLVLMAAVLYAFFQVYQSFPAEISNFADYSMQPAPGERSAQSQAIVTSEDFQAALNAARPGDVITLQAGTVLRGNFLLPAKQGGGSGWITIRSSGIGESLPADGVRVTPAHAAGMARLESSNTEPVLATKPGANHYRFEGIEFTIAPESMLSYGIIRLGEGNETDSSSLPHDLVFDRCYVHGHATADVSRGIALNSAATDIINSYISECHGIGFDTQAIACWNGPGPFNIINNYLEAAGENVIFGGADPTIQGLVPSDIEFRNNHCSKPFSWMEGVFAKPTEVSAQGRSAPGNLLQGTTYYYRISSRGRAGYSTVANSAASDEIALSLDAGQTSASLSWRSADHVTETRIYRTTDPPDASERHWVFYSTTGTSFGDVGDTETAQATDGPPQTGTRWSVKNLFELKNARRIHVDGNVFENNWVDAQSGFSLQFTVRNQDGHSPWSVVEDVIFTNNVVRHSAGGINVLGRDYNHPSEQTKRIDIIGNIFDDIGGKVWGSNGRFLQVTETLDLRINRNTVFQTGNLITVYGVPSQGFVFTNNIALHNQYGIIGDGSGSGDLTLDRFFPGSMVKKNVIVGAPEARYPKKNYYPQSVDQVGFIDKPNGNYELSSSSPYKNAGTKNRDVGADVEAVQAAARRAIQGSP